MDSIHPHGAMMARVLASALLLALLAVTVILGSRQQAQAHPVPVTAWMNSYVAQIETVVESGYR